MMITYGDQKRITEIRMSSCMRERERADGRSSAMRLIRPRPPLLYFIIPTPPTLPLLYFIISTMPATPPPQCTAGRTYSCHHQRHNNCLAANSKHLNWCKIEVTQTQKHKHSKDTNWWQRSHKAHLSFSSSTQNSDGFRERCKKKKKKLTIVSFAFAHTYTLKTCFLFSPSVHGKF